MPHDVKEIMLLFLLPVHVWMYVSKYVCDVCLCVCVWSTVMGVYICVFMICTYQIISNCICSEFMLPNQHR